MFLSRASNVVLLLLRICVGWLVAYQGILAYRTPNWSLSTALSGSQVATDVYHFLLQQPTIQIISNIYPIIMIAIGILIFLGLWMRIGVIIGSIIMILLYLPLLRFPMVGSQFILVDYHIITMLCMWTLWSVHADQFWGLGAQFTINK